MIRDRRSTPSAFRPEQTSEITDLAEDGRGVTRIEGKVTFVDGALPGERVRLRVTRCRKNADYAETVGIGRTSANRVVPRCRYFGSCGGCSLQHLAAAEQVRIKEAQVLSALERIAGVVPDQVAPPLTGPIWSYRRRARLGVNGRTVRRRADETRDPMHAVRVGFRERRRPVVMGLERCEVLDHRVGADLGRLASALGTLDIRGHIPQVEVATSQGCVALVLRVLQPPTFKDRKRLSSFAAEGGISICLQSGGPDSLVPLAGSSMAALNFSPDGSHLLLAFGPTDFVQVNEIAGQAMVRQSVNWLDPKPTDHVLDLFAGLGNFSLPLAASGARVMAVDADFRLVRRGRVNAARNGLSIEFVEADLMGISSKFLWANGHADLALLDPPRAGAREALRLLASERPRRILYASCHPGSLARDTRLLVKEYGFRLSKFGVIDMFPHTTHIESMALFDAR